jgi:hypothetical protein
LISLSQPAKAAVQDAWQGALTCTWTYAAGARLQIMLDGLLAHGLSLALQDVHGRHTADHALSSPCYPGQPMDWRRRFSAGATLQIMLFGVMAIQVKRKAPNCHTILEVVRLRWGTVAHLVRACSAFSVL